MKKPGKNSVVELREIDSDNFKAVSRLRVAPDQQRFIATNDHSIAEAHFSDQAWFRAIYADDTPVGFAMLADELCGTRADPDPNCLLWRFMLDERYQRLGFGTRALEQVVEHVRTHRDAEMLLTSYLPGNVSAANFYRKFGFVPNETRYPAPDDEVGLVYFL